MTTIAMLLSNPFKPDPRVLKEASGLAQRGYQVEILAWDRMAEYPPEESVEEGVQITRIQSVRSAYGVGSAQILRLPRFWAALLPHLGRLQPDIIHCHDFDTLPAGLLWGRLQRRPVIYDAHEYYADLCKPRLHGATGSLLYQAIRSAEHVGARLSSAVVTVDENLAAIYRRLNRRVEVIGHYPYKSLADQAAPVFQRQTLNLLYAGRLSVDRGLLYYADLLRCLKDSGVDVRLTLAGVFLPPSEEALFWERVGDLRPSVDYLGWIPYSQMPPVFQAADVGLAVFMPDPRYVPSRPVKLFEYMASGLPVISSHFPAIAAVINKVGCGFLVDPLEDADVAAQAILGWLESPNIPQEMGRRARQAVLEEYNWERLIELLSQIYQDALDRTQPARKTT